MRVVRAGAISLWGARIFVIRRSSRQSDELRKLTDSLHVHPLFKIFKGFIAIILMWRAIINKEIVIIII
jgi:hypothetical protein